MQLSPDQSAAKVSMLDWFRDFHLGVSDQQIFRIFGFAGTGKTTTIKEIVDDLRLPNAEVPSVQFGAYTGKAALVMSRNGPDARTLHSLIYIPIVPDKEECAELKNQLAAARKSTSADGSAELITTLSSQLRDASKLSFELNGESVLTKADLLVLDECSMVNDEMLTDLLSFGVPILVLGDPGQLPPIEGAGALIRDTPDILFTKIHRQALDNPIINLSMRVREGLSIPLGEYGTSSHVLATKVTVADFKSFDQILVGKNKTRREINTRTRHILGFRSASEIYPSIGDKLICLRNKRDMGLFNGLMCTVLEVLDEYDTTIELRLATETGGEIIVRALRAHFDEYATPGTVANLQWWDFQDGEEFDFGYAITVHKSQGSQWDHIGFYDDKMLIWNKKERRRWLYTGITRAVETITIMS